MDILYTKKFPLSRVFKNFLKNFSGNSFMFPESIRFAFYCLESQIISTLTSAGETPDMRPA